MTTVLADKNEKEMLSLMVLMNSLSGADKTQQGFDNSFNMLLPLLLSDCEDDACKKEQKNLMIVMMSMQSNAPGSAMNSGIIF